MPSGPNTSRRASWSRRQSGHFLEDQAEKEGVEVAVLGAVAGDTEERLRVEEIDGAGAAAARLDVERHVALEAARVIQQHAHRDLVLRATGEPRQIPAHRRVEVQLSLVHQAHGRAGGADDLGDGGDVPEGRVGIWDRRGGAPSEVAISAGVEDRVAATDHHDGARVDPLLDPIPHRGVDLGEGLALRRCTTEAHGEHSAHGSNQPATSCHADLRLRPIGLVPASRIHRQSGNDRARRQSSRLTLYLSSSSTSRTGPGGSR